MNPRKTWPSTPDAGPRGHLWFGVTRFRYRGNTIPNPWTLPTAVTSETVEKPVGREAHGGFGERSGEGGPGVIPTPHPRPTQPDKAVVLCMDVKSQIQALGRTQPSLPMVKKL